MTANQIENRSLMKKIVTPLEKLHHFIWDDVHGVVIKYWKLSITITLILPFLIIALRGGSSFSFSNNIHTYLGWWFGGLVFIGGDHDILYTKTFLQIDRFLVGIVGFALPVSVIMYTDIKLGSISAYYHSTAGWLLTGQLVLLGTLLIIYKGYQKKNQPIQTGYAKVYDSIITNFAGVGAYGLVAFPTKIDNKQLGSTYHEPLRNYYDWLTSFMSPDMIRSLHMIFTALLMLLMIVLFISEFSLITERLVARTSKLNRITNKLKNLLNKSLYHPKMFAENYKLVFYSLCSISIIAGFIVLIPVFLVDRPTYWFEFLGLVGLGGAWLFKGTTSLFESPRKHHFTMILLLIIGFVIGFLIIA